MEGVRERRRGQGALRWSPVSGDADEVLAVWIAQAHALTVGLAVVLVAVNVLVLSWEVRVVSSLAVAGPCPLPSLTALIHSC